MGLLKRPGIAVRLKPLGLALTSLALIAGCNHRRSALRPVFVNPTPVISNVQAPCADPPCAGSESAPAFSNPGDLSNSPPASPLAPARPKTDSVVPQSGEEPVLLPNPSSKGSESPPPLGLTDPKPSRGTGRRPAVGTSHRSDGSRDRVSGFIQEPDDLFMPPKADRVWRYIVLHHSDHATGSYAQIDRDHRDRIGTQGCGYHFVVGNGSESPDGRIEIANRWVNQKAGAHCRDAKNPEANDYGIGVCLVGDLDESSATPKQLEATKALVSYLRERYDIPADRVVSHSAIAQTSTSCAGKLFSVNSVLEGNGFASR
jgi:hypothetical protein